MRPPNAKHRPGGGGAAMLTGNGIAAEHSAPLSPGQVIPLGAYRVARDRLALSRLAARMSSAARLAVPVVMIAPFRLITTDPRLVDARLDFFGAIQAERVGLIDPRTRDHLCRRAHRRARRLGHPASFRLRSDARVKVVEGGGS
jgi:hypothetical protein